jgi:hypothetical protein
MLPEQIAERSEAIRLDKKALARLAKLSQKSTGMTLRGQSSPRLNNLQALERAIVAEEIRLRDYLLAIHPLSTSTTTEQAA